MSNVERAAKIIGEAYETAVQSDIPSAWRTIVAQALDKERLLAPDLPEPDKDSTFVALGPTWEVRKEHGGVYAVTSRNGLVYAPGDTHSPTQARAMALALLAAAHHADRRG